MLMERNWLIRTSQNQILGPVAKQKLLEFIQKGALGMTDEVTSGNGYWFSLKEKELVEKYLYGDIPQSYNPISESKSVLAKRENPEKTTSINTAPANKTQLLKTNHNPGVVPPEDDLAFPDVTVVHTLPKNFNSPASIETVELDKDETKLPNEDDLAFPDMEAMLEASKNENKPFQYAGSPAPAVAEATVVVNNSHAGAASARAPINTSSVSDEEVALPNEDDLAFPDMDDVKTSTKIEKGQVDLSHQYTRTVALDVEQSHKVLPEKVEVAAVTTTKTAPQEIEDDFGTFKLALNLSAKEKLHFPEEPQDQPLHAVAKKERPVQSQDDRKLLHDRKTKSSVVTANTKSPAALRDPSREVVHGNSHAEPLKKRNDNYLFFILIIVLMIIIAVFFYFKEILNKPLPV